MRFFELKEHGGLIVPGVNTTVDVGPDEIKIQAKKFGNSVDKQGKPLYTMHKKAHKNTKPNTLFNLGMAESKKEKQKPIKARDPNWRDMEALRKSGAAGTHQDKTKIIPRKQKYKDDVTEDATKKQLSMASEIYVDMDGVLADFFPAWKAIVGKDWREIDDIESALQKIRDKDDFWLTIPLTPNAKQLLGIIKDLKGEYKILSAPLADDPRVEPHKREWVEKNLSFFPPKEVIITKDKWKFAKQPDGTPNILIDDFGSNVRNWIAKGGVGFKHKDHKFERTASNLKDYFKEPAVAERELDKSEEKEKERIVKGMKKASKDFKDRYGDNWKAVMYATATKLAKEGYDLTETGYEDPSYFYMTGGMAPPQVRDEDLTEFTDGEKLIHISKLKPVQRERSWEKLHKQMLRVRENDYAPIVIDNKGYIVNGHHRYDALKFMGEQEVKVRIMKGSLHEIISLMQDK